MVFPITYINLWRNGIGNPSLPNNRQILICIALLRVSMKCGNCTLRNIFVAPKQYTGTTGMLCCNANLKTPLRCLNNAASSLGWNPGLGYVSNISAMPPGDIPIRLFACDSTDDTALLDASMPPIHEMKVLTNGKSFVAVATTGRYNPQVLSYPRWGRHENANPNGKIPWGMKAYIALECRGSNSGSLESIAAILLSPWSRSTVNPT